MAIGEPAVDPLLRSLVVQSEPALGHSIRALGQIAAKMDSLAAEPVKTRCRQQLGCYLKHPAPFIRLCAVEALGRMMNEETRTILTVTQQNEANPFVLNAYRSVLKPKGN